ncbi:small subunit ribosomal protein S28e [Nematocida homosporus]|uniref:small subunit ribosomal protein S28e n=1 Tax=Nematocida homosporus TaxID=1912981 RepID=UPI00221ED40A|nr:small subunit ribosomal protein S28e [Nematocida homosporus]KAI5187342.1 small subunit ribosomal protein S28e [Nematocida homosporus]
MADGEGQGNQPVLVEVVEVYNPTGPGGGSRGAKVKILSTGRHITRVIYGPVRTGDQIYLLEAERDQKLGGSRR